MLEILYNGIRDDARSFAEKIISAANLIMTKDRSSTSLNLLDMMVTIRMNRTFMARVRKTKYYGSINIIRGLSKIGKVNSDDL